MLETFSFTSTYEIVLQAPLAHRSSCLGPPTGYSTANPIHPKSHPPFHPTASLLLRAGSLQVSGNTGFPSHPNLSPLYDFCSPRHPPTSSIPKASLRAVLKSQPSFHPLRVLPCFRPSCPHALGHPCPNHLVPCNQNSPPKTEIWPGHLPALKLSQLPRSNRRHLSSTMWPQGSLPLRLPAPPFLPYSSFSPTNRSRLLRQRHKLPHSHVFVWVWRVPTPHPLSIWQNSIHPLRLNSNVTSPVWSFLIPIPTPPSPESITCGRSHGTLFKTSNVAFIKQDCSELFTYLSPFLNYELCEERGHMTVMFISLVAKKKKKNPTPNPQKTSALQHAKEQAFSTCLCNRTRKTTELFRQEGDKIRAVSNIFILRDLKKKKQTKLNQLLGASESSSRN